MAMKQLQTAAMALMVAMVLVMGCQLGENTHVYACSNELNRVANSCGSVVSSGTIPGYSSACCATLRSVDIRCACSQASAIYKGSGSIVSPSTAAAIRNSCRVNIPKGIKCAGLNN